MMSRLIVFLMSLLIVRAGYGQKFKYLDAERVIVYDDTLIIDQLDTLTLKYVQQQLAIGANKFNIAGIKAFENGKIEEAEKYFSQAIKYSPRSEDGYLNRSKVYLFTKSYSQAIADLKEVARLGSQQYQVYQGLAFTYQQQGQYRLALQQINIAISLADSIPEIWNDRGVISQALGQKSQAINDFQKAISINPNYAEAYHNLGILKTKMGLYKEAISFLDKACTLDSVNPILFNSRGLVYLHLNDYQSALSNFNQAISLSKATFPEALNNRAIIKHKLKDYHGAIQDCELALTAKPEFSEAYFNRGLAKSMLKQTEAACKDWKQASELGLPIAIDYYKSQCE